MSLLDELRSTLNRNSAENGSDTPDFVLATFLSDCLSAWDKAVAARELWYGRGPGMLANLGLMPGPDDPVQPVAAPIPPVPAGVPGLSREPPKWHIGFDPGMADRPCAVLCRRNPDGSVTICLEAYSEQAVALSELGEELTRLRAAARTGDQESGEATKP